MDASRHSADSVKSDVGKTTTLHKQGQARASGELSGADAKSTADGHASTTGRGSATSGLMEKTSPVPERSDVAKPPTGRPRKGARSKPDTGRSRATSAERPTSSAGSEQGKSREPTSGDSKESVAADDGDDVSGGYLSVGLGPRILRLSLASEWIGLDQLLRNANIDKKELENLADEGTGVTPLMMAVKDNKLATVDKLLDLGAPVNAQARDGRTVLHFAAWFAKEDVMKTLLGKRADATIVTTDRGQLPLHVACARQLVQLSVIQILLKVSGKDARLSQDLNGYIPLMLAAEVGNTQVCKELVNVNGETQVKMQKRDTGETVLHIASRRKDVDMARVCVDSGCDVDAQNDEGHTPLHIACWEGDEALIKFFYQAKANPHIYDKLDRSPLHIAAERGHTNIVEGLIDKFKASVSARTKDGSTLMHIASQCGHPDTALAFMKKGVPLHMPNKSGAVALHAAAKRGHTGVVRALLQKGSIVDAKTKENYTALHIAVQHCKPLVVQTLLGYGAQVQIKGGKLAETPLHIAARVKDGEKCAEMLLKSGADVDVHQENGETALHIAARYGHLKMVQLLLEEGGDIQWQAKLGESPLHVAVKHCHFKIAHELLSFLVNEKTRTEAVTLVNMVNLEGESPMHYAGEITKTMAHYVGEDTDIIKILLSYDGDVNVLTKLTYETVLHYCARAGNEGVLIEIVKHLGMANVQVATNKQAKNGWSPLLVASEQGHAKIVNILLQNHARVDVFDEHGKAALHVAAENGHADVVGILLRNKAFVNSKSKLGVTPLHLTAMNGYNKLVKMMIESHGATMDALSLAKKTPLHYAAQNGQLEVCKTLLHMKDDANAKDNHGQTPLHLAAENDHSDVVKLFLKYKPELVTMANTHGMTCAHIAASKGSVAVIKELMKFNKIIITAAKNKTTGSTALHLAAEGGYAAVVKVLLEAGALSSEENTEGMTPLHLAAKYGHVNVLEGLRSAVSWKIPSKKTGLTALHVAAHHGHIDFVREMLSKVPATIKSEAVSHDMDMQSPMKDIMTDSGLTPLHLAAQSGHEGLVRLLLNSPGVQIDTATNVHGTIPLHMAAQSGHSAVVGLLLSKSTYQLHVKDRRGRTALHLSAANGHLDMVALLIGQGAEINIADKIGWTSLHFAAKNGFLGVVKLLVQSGAAPSCESKEGRIPLCFAAAFQHHDVLSFLMRKEHNTQALMEDKKFVYDLMVCGKTHDDKAIDEFILVSPAPVETASKLSKHFRDLGAREKERARDLITASKHCENMATELLAIASGLHSAGLLLRSLDNRGTPFLDVLIENEQKEVVAHPAVQRYLSDVWTGNLRWGTWKIIAIFIICLVCPPVWIVVSLPWKNRYNRVPIVKFMSYLISHVYFIFLLTITVVIPFNPIYESGTLLPHWYEWLLLAWLSGLLVAELTNPGDRTGLGWIRIIILTISALGISVHVCAFVFPLTDNAGVRNRQTFIYIRNQFLSVSLLLCFVQLLEFLSFHHLFGPWAIIIQHLMKDLARFLVILLIFMAGFTLNIAAIYQPVYEKLPDEDVTLQNPILTFEMLFFSLFGLVEPDNLPPTPSSPDFAFVLIKFAFGIYMLVTLIVLINLLIAMMSDTYQRIQAESDTEWKFGRAKLIRNMNKTSATPSPLNLFTKFLMYIRVAFKHKGKVCSIRLQEIMYEEEQQGQSDPLSYSDEYQQSGGNAWLRNLMRRPTQVAPEAGFLRLNVGPRNLSDVCNWDNVVNKYLSAQGKEGPDEVDEGGDHDVASSMVRLLRRAPTTHGGN